ncbi:DUF4258 domain-containing protein [Clostridium perfringens]|uniref:DUF4258 domain-containing protein n=1 Tax=Clostridium perfringens TaxID=1502 RepID=UPI003AF442A1
MIDDLAKFRSMIAEENIRKKVSEGKYFMSSHALNRMSEREIPEDKVIECIINGKNIEAQIGKEINDFKILFQEGNKEKPEVYTVVADRDIPVIVTVCRTNSEVWECVDSILKRREICKA